MGDNMLTVAKAGGAGEKDTNPTRYIGDIYATDSVYQRPIKMPVTDWRIIAVKYAGLAGMVVLGLIIYSIWHTIHCWDGANYAECQAWDFWLPRAIAGALILAGFTKLIQWSLDIWTDAKSHLGEARRMQFDRDRFGNLVPTRLYDSLDDRTLLEVYLSQYSASTQLKALTAPYEQFNGVNTLSMGNTTTSNVSSNVAVEPVEEGQVLPDIVPVAEWLPWLTDKYVPHLLLTGKTRSGKSTLADVILKFRADRGDKIAILDPHWSTQDKYGNKKWGGIAPIAKNVPEIITALKALRAEYDDRFRRMQLPASDPDFVPEMEFEPITVLIDEVPEVITALGKDPLWNETVKIFGSGGAKVNIYVILLSQSPNVEDVGMNAKMRENFCTIALPDLTQKYIERYAGDKQKKEELLTLLREHTKPTMKPYEFPIAAEFAAKMHILSRDGVLSHRVREINAAVWSVWSEKKKPILAQSTSVASRPSQTDAQTQAQTQEITKLRRAYSTEEGRLLILAAMQRKGYTRERAREKLREFGLSLDNNDWARVGKR